ncbi:MAG: S8 family serine peptidase, partial [Ignavibacteria bacterium]|nr:S8 family serine peptidase [Ignavibacteria bacterium]
MKKIIILTLILSFCQINSQFLPKGISGRLQNAIVSAKPENHIRFFVLLKDRVDIERLDEELYRINASPEFRAKTVITSLMQKASATQGPIVEYLKEQMQTGRVRNFQQYWISNFIWIEAVPSVIFDIASRTDIDELDLDAELDYDRPVAFEPAGDKTESVEPGLRVINAHLLWQIGITGSGRLVMSEDTGVNGNHPSLNYKWRGNNGAQWYHAWLDPTNPNSNFPVDCDNHGTHTTGIMTGRAGSDTIGVAPDAQWIAARTICSGNSTNNHMYAFQWAMNPDSNVNTTNDMPDAVNCSWHDPSQPVGGDCTGIYVSVLAAMEAAGIAVVFSAGNSGPGASTITRPKNMNANLVRVFCVGNINGNVSPPYPINSSSSRGPANCGGPGKLLFKPEVSAPGTSVRSALISGYGSLTGTSMASPHVAGAVALLKQAFPNRTGKEILEALYWTAIDHGSPGEDNTYGMGVIDCWAAYRYLLGQPCRTQDILIRDNQTNYDTVFVNKAGIITDVNVTIGTILHSRTGDIEFSIKSPAGTEVILASRRGGSGANYINTTFNDSAATPISGGTPPFTGSFRPESPLSVFNGQSMLGEWIFRVNDNQTSDTGRAMNYCITIYHNNIVGIGNNNIPVYYSLEQNYPNPFNPSTSIRYTIPKESFVKLTVYDISGREVMKLSDDFKQAGTYDVIFNASNLSSGIYFYTM